MRGRILVLVLGLLFLACSGVAVLFWDGYYLPIKPCRPILYPSGERTSKHTSTATASSIDTLLSFYDRQLNVQFSSSATMGHWSRMDLGSGNYGYSCAAADINGLSSETGCIYISQQPNGFLIETLLIRSEGSNLPCPRK